MKLMVTGGAGFIGSHVCDLLTAHGDEVQIVDNFTTGRRENLATHGRIPEYFRGGDILNWGQLESAFDKYQPDTVIHLAAQPAISTSIERPWYDMDVNVLGTRNVIRACKEFGVERVVFSSTSAVYAHSDFNHMEDSLLKPDSPYGISKLTAEMYIRYMLPASVILRFGNVYGPRQVPLGENQLIARIIRHFEYGDPFYIHGDGEQSRDFVYVGDVARAVVLASLEGLPGTYNIASGQSHSVNAVAKLFEALYEVRGYKWEHDESRDERNFVGMDVSLAEEMLSWIALVPLHLGLSQTLEWWKANDKSPHQP